MAVADVPRNAVHQVVRVRVVPAAWIAEWNRGRDCGPYSFVKYVFAVPLQGGTNSVRFQFPGALPLARVALRLRRVSDIGKFLNEYLWNKTHSGF